MNHLYMEMAVRKRSKDVVTELSFAFVLSLRVYRPITFVPESGFLWSRACGDGRSFASGLALTSWYRMLASCVSR
jgi:hypothetical protein